MSLCWRWSPSRCATTYRSAGSGGREIRDRVGHGSCAARVIDNHLKRSGIKITPAHEADRVLSPGSPDVKCCRLDQAEKRPGSDRSIASDPAPGCEPTIELRLMMLPP